MNSAQKYINEVIVAQVEWIVIADNPLMSSPEYRKRLPIEEKKRLVRLMCNAAIARGAVPIKPINI